MHKFPNQELERRFWRRRAVELARRDSQACLLLAFIYAGATLTFLFQSESLGRPFGKYKGLWGVALWLAAAALQHCAPGFYVRHRRAVVAGFRILCLLLPAAAPGIAEYRSRTRLQASPASLPSILVVGAQMPLGWIMGLGLQLDLITHLLLGLLGATLLGGRAAATCRAPYIQHPALTERFHAASKWLNCLATLLVPTAEWRPGGAPATPQEGVWDCWCLLATVHGVGVLLLSSVVVSILEQRARREFLRAEAAGAAAGAAAEGRSGGLGEAAQRLGLPIEQLTNICTFEPLAVAVWYAALLPAAVAATWLAAATLSRRLLVQG